jgi:tetratricopeptide (TPR) repeat protein
MKRTIAGCCAAFLCAGITVSCNAANEQTLRQYARAKEMYAQGRFAETSSLLEDTKKFGPALTLRGKAEYFSGDLDKAELSCRRAMRRQPAAFEAKLYLARVLREKGETENAEKLAFALLSDNPYDIRALRFASALASQQGRTHEAKVLLDQAAELSAENAMVLLDRARLHWKAGRSAEALEDLERAQLMLPWDTPLAKSIEHLESVIRMGTLPDFGGDREAAP